MDAEIAAELRMPATEDRKDARAFLSIEAESVVLGADGALLDPALKPGDVLDGLKLNHVGGRFLDLPLHASRRIIEEELFSNPGHRIVEPVGVASGLLNEHLAIHIEDRSELGVRIFLDRARISIFSVDRRAGGEGGASERTESEGGKGEQFFHGDSSKVGRVACHCARPNGGCISRAEWRGAPSKRIRPG